MAVHLQQQALCDDWPGLSSETSFRCGLEGTQLLHAGRVQQLHTDAHTRTAEVDLALLRGSHATLEHGGEQQLLVGSRMSDGRIPTSLLRPLSSQHQCHETLRR